MAENDALLARLDRLENQINEAQEQNAISHREIYGRLNQLERGEAAQNVQYNAIMEKLDNLTRKVEALEAKPAKRWDGLVTTAITAIAAAIIAFVLAKAGIA